MRARIFAAIESLALALWIGALAGFAFVFAPIAFHTVRNTGEFATLIGTVLRTLGWMGAACAAAALVSIVLGRRGSVQNRAVRGVLVALMAALSLYVTLSVIPQMEATAKLFGAPFGAIAKSDSRRVRYDRLHASSSRLYGAVLVMGAAAIILAAASGERGRVRRG